MKKTIILFALFFITFINSCSKIGFNPGSYSNGYYNVLRFNSNGKEIRDYVKFDKVHESGNLIVYVQSGCDFDSSSVRLISNEFDKYYKSMVNVYGEHTDVDGNGKIIILLFNINSSYSGPIVTGYFYSLDLYAGYFNNGEILYMDLREVNRNPDNMAGTILHELQHLINFNVNWIKNNRDMSSWLNEALSESTSILFNSYTVDSRIWEFNNIDYYCFYTWNLPLDIFSNYPSASLFMNWLYKRSGRNVEIFRNIAASPQVDDYMKVVNSASRFGISSSWDDLLLKWMEGVNNNEIIGGVKANLNYCEPSKNIKLYPGALVAYNGSLQNSGNLVTKSLSGGRQLALNKDTSINKNPSSINITTPSYSSSPSSMIRASKVNESNESYKPKYRNILFGSDGKLKDY